MSVIPFVHQSPLLVGPFTIYPYNLLVATAIWTACVLILRRSRRFGVSWRVVVCAVSSMVVISFVSSHCLSLLTSDHHRPFSALEVLNIWAGMSTFGGLFGALVGAFVFKGLSRISWRSFFIILDASAFSAPFAWIFARAGCSLAHDHPGIHAENWLSVAFPGGDRYDLGLLELFFSILMSCVFLMLDRKQRPAGWFIVFVLVTYGPFRFVLDFLQENRELSLGLTLTQWMSGLFTFGGLFLAPFLLSRKQIATPHKQVQIVQG
jgi:phosphatidylglycerol:prolipoprotein diacylglycerol transferase